MPRESFSIGAFYNITKNQHNPIKTVGRDSFVSPKTPNNTSFLGLCDPWWLGRTAPIFYGTQLDPYNICPRLIEIGSKTAEKNSAQTNKQTNNQTDRQTDRQTNQQTL